MEIGPLLTSWGDIGLSGIVMVTVSSLLLGLIVPYRQVKDLRVDRDKRIEELREENKELKEAARMAIEAREQSAKQVTELLEVGKLANDLMRALHKASEPTP